jgi:transposase
MPRPYDNDLRRIFLAAYAAGKGTQAELALVFGVSVGWAEKVCRQHRQSGQPERIEQRHGPTSRVDAVVQACLLDAIKERPDLTLAELQEILAVRRGVRLCIGQLWNVLKKMGIRLKKVDPRHRARHREQSSKARTVHRTYPVNAAGTPDFPRRKWGDHLNDAHLRTPRRRSSYS